MRELGYGDVAVNKKMKDLNKILYDILLKISNEVNNSFKINKSLIIKYFNQLDDNGTVKYQDFERYLNDFINFVLNYLLKI